LHAAHVAAALAADVHVICARSGWPKLKPLFVVVLDALAHEVLIDAAALHSAAHGAGRDGSFGP
jgi:hypothetical protein